MKYKAANASSEHCSARRSLSSPLWALRPSPTQPTRQKSTDAAYAEIDNTMGGVPTSVKLFPWAGIAGAWAEERDLEMSDKTALDPKTKASTDSFMQRQAVVRPSTLHLFQNISTDIPEHCLSLASRLCLEERQRAL